MYIFLNRLLELIPVLLAFLVMQLFAFNDGTLFHYSFMPYVSVMCVYYWVFNYSEVVGTMSVFIIGIISDIVFLNPLGLESFSLLVAYLLTVNQRDVITRYGFLLLWIYFALFCLIFVLVRTILMSLYVGSFVLDYTVLAQFLLTLFLYPIIHRLFSFFHIKRITNFKI